MNKENIIDNKLTKKFWILTIVISLILIAVVTIGFYLFSNRTLNIVEKTESGGKVILNYTSSVSGLNIINAVPTMDSIGMKNTLEGQYLDFSVQSSLDSATSVEYEISIIKDPTISTINDEDIRIYLEKEKRGTYTKVFGPVSFKSLKKDTDLGSKSGSMVIAKVKKSNSNTDNYRLRMWLAGNATTTTGNYAVELDLKGKAK